MTPAQRLLLLGKTLPPNLLTNTEAFNGAAWSIAFATIGANAAVAPDGQTTADRLTEDTNNNVHTVFRTPTLPAGIYTLSNHFKQDSLTRGALCLSSPDGSKYTALVDAAGGAIIEGHDTGTPISKAIEIVPAAQGYYRVGVTIYCTAGVVGASIGTAASDTPSYAASGLPTYLGTGSGIFIWGAQLELGSRMTPYRAMA
jgi:hypothetical protein